MVLDPERSLASRDPILERADLVRFSRKPQMPKSLSHVIV